MTNTRFQLSMLVASAIILAIGYLLLTPADAATRECRTLSDRQTMQCVVIGEHNSANGPGERSAAPSRSAPDVNDGGHDDPGPDDDGGHDTPDPVVPTPTPTPDSPPSYGGGDDCRGTGGDSQ